MEAYMLVIKIFLCDWLCWKFKSDEEKDIICRFCFLNTYWRHTCYFIWQNFILCDCLCDDKLEDYVERYNLEGYMLVTYHYPVWLTVCWPIGKIQRKHCKYWSKHGGDKTLSCVIVPWLPIGITWRRTLSGGTQVGDNAILCDFHVFDNFHDLHNS